MFIDSRAISSDREIETDVCIVGAGAAGITLARELSNRSFRVTLVESGGAKLEDAVQDLNRGRNVGLPYYPLASSRLRYFGGTTNHWGGESRPLDAIDFEARDWMPESGWPFGRDALDPYYPRAQEICGLGPFDYRPSRWVSPETPQLALSKDRIITTIFQRNAPLRFGPAYAPELETAKNLRVMLHGNVVDLEASGESPRIRRMRVSTLAGNRFWLRGKVFLLALGAIETTRLLLQSDVAAKGGFGRSQPLIGRYFAEHPYVELGSLLPSNSKTGAALIRRSTETIDETGIVRALTFPPERLRAERLPNFQIFFEKAEANEGNGSDALAAAGIVDAGVSPIRVSITFEPRPDSNSRVRLGNERDALGQRRVDLDWRVDPAQKPALRRIADSLGRDFARAGLGRLRVSLDDDEDAWRTPPRGSWHQLGCTRMNSDPSRGVVDASCRVHGIDNLYLASGSVFPTVGYANPTLNIVALCLRIAERVGKSFT